MAKTYKTSVLSVFDENGNKIEIPALRGKSAYEYAKANGYTGSEADFAEEINPENIKSDIPTKTSELTNDSNYITKAVTDLTNYYLKSETYTQDEINALVSAIPKFSIEVVTSLPTANISNTTVYLVKSSDETSNLYDEYIYVNNAWEHLGSQTIDVSNKMDKVTGGTTNNFIALDANGNARDSSYNSTSFVPMSAFSGAIVPHMNDATKHITANERAAWNAKSDFDGNYNSLTNKPTIPTNVSQLTNDLDYITSSDYCQLKFYSVDNLYYLNITKNGIIETIPLTLHSSSSNSEDLTQSTIAYSKLGWCFELDETTLNNIFNTLKESNNIKIFIDFTLRAYGQTGSYAYIYPYQADYPGLYFNFGNSLQVRIKAAPAGGAPDEPV